MIKIEQEFSSPIADALRMGGWTVAPHHAFRHFASGIRGFVFPSGQWSLFRHKETITRGKDETPILAALAACDAVTKPEKPGPAVGSIAKRSPDLTRPAYLIAYEAELHARYNIAARDMAAVLRSVEETLNGLPNWDCDHEAAFAAWRAINGLGPVTMQKLRALPKRS